MYESPEIAIIGAGNMGEALIKGWLASGVFEASCITVSERDELRCGYLVSEYGVKVAASNREAAQSSSLVTIAVKPQDCMEVLGEIASVMDADKTLVSVVAGLTIGSIRSVVGSGPSVVRAMPNVAAHVRAAVSGYAVDPGEGSFDTSVVERLLGAVGEQVEVREEWMDLVTAVSGSGPAYFFSMVEALEKAARKIGLPDQVAAKLSRGALWGAAKVLKETGREPGDLRRLVSSPGGTTVAALFELEKAGFESALEKAVEAARRRAGELAR